MMSESDEENLPPEPELVRKHGYPIEVHTVKTKDKYLLTVHRIPYGKRNTKKENRKPIYLMHGFVESSGCWILLGPKQGLAYLLADLGYDVWLGNARGNKYSRHHSILDPDKNANTFWDFSWHEIGFYDLPATIDYILNHTQQEKIFYVGHSQGCTAFFVMASLRPQYNEKIALMFALAPMVFMGNCQCEMLNYAAYYLSIFQIFLKLIAENEFMPSSSFNQFLATNLCHPNSGLQPICEKILYLLAGDGTNQMDRKKLPIMLSSLPAGVATKQLIHYLQIRNNEDNSFTQFDYGPIQNVPTYFSVHPPEYPLNKVTAPVALISSYGDILIDSLDTEKLNSVLPNVILNYYVPLKQFNHVDFLWGKDVVSLVYNKIFKLLNTFQK